MLWYFPTQEFFEGPATGCLVDTTPIIQSLVGFLSDLSCRAEERWLVCFTILYYVVRVRWNSRCLLAILNTILGLTLPVFVSGIEFDIVILQHRVYVSLIRQILKEGALFVVLLLLVHQLLAV